MKQFILDLLPFGALGLLFMFAVSCANAQPTKKQMEYELKKGEQEAFFADACYWCTEGIWESLNGVISVESGFVGGTRPDKPTYAEHGNFAEGNRIVYDPLKISYAKLVDAYFDGHSHGRSPDRGQSYRAIAFYDGDIQKQQAEDRFKREINSYGEFKQELKDVKEANWFIGPRDHQDYIARLERGESVPNAAYGRGESIPRRDRALRKISARQKKKLNKHAYRIMVKKGTERPFSSPLNGEKRSGYYVSAATGDTLFRSTAKFDSGTGWPSFDSATGKVALGKAEQGGYEVIEKSNGYHLGHLFLNENFTDEDKRYCINGDALEFIPDEL